MSFGYKMATPTRTATATETETETETTTTTTTTAAAAETETATATATSITAIKSRIKLKDINRLITCPLCQGYLIEATTVNDCLHTFCRSCIVMHLEKHKFCPCCEQYSKPVNCSSLRPDRILKSLIYKIVPGLYQAEYQRLAEFHGATGSTSSSSSKSATGHRRFSGLVGIPNKNKNSQSDSLDDINHNYKRDQCELDDQDYFSPEEPISLSLEYHPDALMECSKDSLPPIRYLQCPAAVTIWHLQRFLSSKFDLNPDMVVIEVIYEDEILPKDFSLMDVAYCYNWKRVSPMHFYYRIYTRGIKITTPNKSTKDKTTLIDEKKMKDENKENSRNTKSSVSSESSRAASLAEQQSETTTKTMTTTTTTTTSGEESATKRKSEKIKREPNVGGSSGSGSVGVGNIADKTVRFDLNREKVTAEGHDEFDFVDETPKNYNGNNGMGGPGKRISFCGVRDIIPNVRIEKMKLDDGVKSVKLTMITPKPDVKVKKEHKIKQQSQVNDFKRLRSNDMRSSDLSGDVPLRLDPPKVNKSGTVPDGDSQQFKMKHNVAKIKNTSTDAQSNVMDKRNSAVDDKQQTVVSDEPKAANNVVVTIPQAMVKNLGEDDLENMSLSCFKSFSKKCYMNKKRPNNSPSVTTVSGTIATTQINGDGKSNQSPNVPKVTIDLPSLKSKISVPKAETFPTAADKPNLSPKLERDNKTPNKFEYVKNIGLKPIFPIETLAVDSKKANGNKMMDPSAASSHKKRKKAKHSKETGSKRPKLHAEISSQDEALKLKLKFTSNKTSKHERKGSNGNEDLSLKSNNNKTEDVTPKTSNLVPIKSNKELLLEMRAVRHKPVINVPGLKRAISEDSKAVSNLGCSANDATTSLAPTVTLKKPQMAQIQVNLKPLSQASIVQENKVNGQPAENSMTKSAPILPNNKPLPSLSPKLPMPEPRPIPISSSNRLTPSSPRHVPSYANFTMPFPRRPSPSLKPHPVTSTQTWPTPTKSSLTSILKRCASLDSSLPQLPKQQKIDEFIYPRKPIYMPAQPIVNRISPDKQIPKKVPTPPIRDNTGATVTVPMRQNLLERRPSKEQSCEPYYTSTMGSSYTHENHTKKPIPMLIPPSSISVTKMTEKILSTQASVKRPAVEIVRITSNTPPIDQQMHYKTNPVSAKATTTKTTRPPPPTIPLVKIKKSAQMANNSNQSGLLNKISQSGVNQGNKPSNVGMQKPATASSTNKIAPLDIQKAQSSDNIEPSPVCDDIGALDLSGKSSRSPSVEKSPTSPGLLTLQNPLQNAVQTPTEKKEMRPVSSPENKSTSNKQKSVNFFEDKTSVVKSKSMPTNKSPLEKSEATPKAKAEPNTTGNTLQNLKMLSDSALNREKLMIGKSTVATTTLSSPPVSTARQLPLPKLNEINKMRNSSTVRQQNPSVRNIPNPSALAFRNQSLPATSTTNHQSKPAAISTSIVTAKSTETVATSSSSSSSSLSQSSATATAAVSVSSSSLSSATVAAASPKSSVTGTNTTTPATNTNIKAVASKAPIASQTSSISTTTSSSSSSASISSSSTSTAQLSSSSSSSSSSTAQPKLTMTATTPAVVTTSTTTTTTTTPTTASNKSDSTEAQLIAAKKNLHIEKLAASLRAAAGDTSATTATINVT